LFAAVQSSPVMARLHQNLYLHC